MYLSTTDLNSPPLSVLIDALGIGTMPRLNIRLNAFNTSVDVFVFIGSKSQ